MPQYYHHFKIIFSVILSLRLYLSLEIYHNLVEERQVGVKVTKVVDLLDTRFDGFSRVTVIDATEFLPHVMLVFQQ